MLVASTILLSLRARLMKRALHRQLLNQRVPGELEMGIGLSLHAIGLQRTLVTIRLRLHLSSILTQTPSERLELRRHTGMLMQLNMLVTPLTSARAPKQ